MKTKYLYNYFESEIFKIKTIQNKFKDKFELNFNYDEEIIEIKRIDFNPNEPGWGQDLKLSVYNKLLFKTEIVKIGSSKSNIINFKYNFNKNEINNCEKNYFENDLFKIFHISPDFNDIFKINYIDDNNVLIIKRLDSNEGWGDDLSCKIIYKKNNDNKIIHIGPSIHNDIYMNINLYKLFNIKKIGTKKEKKQVNDNFENNDFEIVQKKEINEINKTLYEFENYIITLHNFIYNDKFLINFYEDNNTLFIKRLDSNEGWGASLILNIYSKKEDYNYLIYIGPSYINEIYKKVSLIKRKVYVSLTTIPSRIKLPEFYNNIVYFLTNQTYPIEKLYIVIPLKYKRFNEEIDDKIIEDLKKLDKVSIIRNNIDYGPASKYLSPLLDKYNELENNLLVVIDDDRYYNKNLIKNFVIAYNSNPNIIFSSGYWKDYFDPNYRNIDDDKLDIFLFKEKNNNKFFFGQGLGGFYGYCIKITELEKFIDYNLKVLKRIPKSFYHDEGILLGYLKYKEETIMYLNHKGCNFINNEMVDALCESNLVNRGNIEKEILQITNLEKLL